MRKRIILAIGVLILISLYFVLVHNRSGQIHEYSFHLADTSSINRIVVLDSNSHVEISKVQGQWLVNQHFHANQLMVKQLFRIFRNLDIVGLVLESERDSLHNYLNNKGLKLQFYKDQKVLREFWLGSYLEDKNATLIMNDENLVAYLVAPGLSKNIRKFIETDPLFWRDKLIFNFSSGTMKQIELIDHQNSDDGFLIEKYGDGYKLFDKEKQELSYDRSKLLRYLSYYGNIYYEAISDKLIDSFLVRKPVYEIKTISQEGQSIRLALYQKPDDQNVSKPDLNYVYGIMNGEKPVLVISYFQIDPALKGIEYFKF